LICTGAAEAPSFTVSSQNCNSLNLTGLSCNLDAKLEAITSVKSDFILLSDVRLVNSKGVKGSERIKRYLRNNRNRAYDLHHHSSGNGRGVAILIAMSLNIVINREWRDQAENAMLMDITLGDYTVTLGSIYGPNNTGREFYRFLNQAITESTGKYKIIGGDWNTVLDSQPIPQNIDVINMVSIPNPVNGNLLRDLCANHSMSDPFRVLYPNKKDYTYSPFGDTRKNRSRLDFFIMTDNLIPSLAKCTITNSVLCSHFDHKNVAVAINSDYKNLPKKPKLTNSFLNSRYLSLSVAASAREVHLNAIDTTFNENNNLPANFATTADFIADSKRQLASLKNILRELESLELRKATNDSDAHLDLLVSAKIASASLALENMPSLQVLSSFRYRCSHSRFFEVLVEQTKKAGMKSQKKLAYHEKVRKEDLIKKIENLKPDYDRNQVQIFKLEKTLEAIIDNELREKLLEIKSFECLHAEKPTAHFLNIAKKTANLETLDSIKNDNGDDFDNNEDRNEYITNFYSSLYRKDETVEGEIENFLGPDICNHPVVTGSKLTDAERTALDAPLRIEELDVALNKANIKSAPGCDGFSYRFIIRFWDIYRYALFECARESFETGIMPDAFRTASIRLIPKKGNVSQIKNWRPISLLSNFYKIISRMVNNRLKKVTDRVLSRSQKGFNRSRQIQEVIINSMETMDFCKRNNIKGAMVSV